MKKELSIEDRKIFNNLNSDLDFMFMMYEEQYVFGIYTFGDCSKTYSVVIPSFEDICLNENLIEETLYNDSNDREIKVMDSRLLYRGTENGFPEIIKSLYTDYYIINPRYEHIYEKLFRANREDFSEGISKKSPSKKLKYAIMQVMKAALNDNSNTICFIKTLTELEKTAISEIIAAVGDEGVFSQAKVASAAGISRYGMTQLIMKMKLHKVAEIIYCGNKGTYIKILDDTLLNIRSNSN